MFVSKLCVLDLNKTNLKKKKILLSFILELFDLL